VNTKIGLTFKSDIDIILEITLFANISPTSGSPDMKNIGSTMFGGSIQAAQFLKRFINDNIPWAHLDIAGVTWSMKNTQNGFSELHAQGATAFGVRLIDQFLKNK